MNTIQNTNAWALASTRSSASLEVEPAFTSATAGAHFAEEFDPDQGFAVEGLPDLAGATPSSLEVTSLRAGPDSHWGLSEW